jgi:hypothetical protein
LNVRFNFADIYPKVMSLLIKVIPKYSPANTYMLAAEPSHMPKISLDMPAELVEDLRKHVGDQHKFVSLADAVRTACRKLLDQLDEIDARHGR